jgi:hypothetical protein
MKLPASIRIIDRGTAVEDGVDVDRTGVIVAEAFGEFVGKPPSASGVSLAHAPRSSADADSPASFRASRLVKIDFCAMTVLTIICITNDCQQEDQRYSTQMTIVQMSHALCLQMLQSVTGIAMGAASMIRLGLWFNGL